MLALLATATCTVKRTAIASGKRDPATAATVLSGLACTPPTAADVSELGAYVQEGAIQSVNQVAETVVVGAQDIRPNDWLTSGGVTYLVIAAGAWQQVGATHCTMERILQ